MNQDALTLRNLISSGEIDFDEMRTRILALPRSEIAQSQTLLAAFASVTDDNRLRMAALARIAYIGRQQQQAPAQAARAKARAGVAKAWATKFGPGFDLYACIARHAHAMDIQLMALHGDDCDNADWRVRVPAKAEQRRITGAVKRELIERFPERWGAESHLYLDKTAFEGAAARPVFDADGFPAG